MYKFFLIAFCCLSLVSCQFTESIVIDESGAGTLTLTTDMKEMLALGGGQLSDSIESRVDTIVHMKDVLKLKKDSIKTLPKQQQDRLKKLEDYTMHMVMDVDKNELFFDIYRPFSKVENVENMMAALSEMSSFMPGSQSNFGAANDDPSTEIIGVKYSFKKGKFIRDAFIKDPEKHKQQVDSLKSSEAFLSTMNYTLKYTFPRKIKKASIEDASYSLDGKTIEVEVGFVSYFKNPDVLDLEIELEKK